jgi:hypothetical protein
MDCDCANISMTKIQTFDTDATAHDGISRLPRPNKLFIDE